MKLKNSIIVSLVAILTLSSCNALNIEQQDKLSASNMWKTSTQVESSTYGIYSRIRSAFIADQLNALFWGELRVGHYMWSCSPRYNVWVGKDVMESTMNASNASASWASMYNAIDQANAVYKYAQDETITMAQDRRDWAVGQAAFARAYCYFWAARIWGDVPLNLLPIESVSQDETYPERAPKAKVYEQIGKDIETALSKADNLGSDKYYATKNAVLMLKAEWALWMYTTQKGGDSYLTLASDALSTIGISSSLLCDDYGDVFDRMKDVTKKSPNSKEVVFALYNNQTEGLTGGYSRYFTFPEAIVAPDYKKIVPIMETQWLAFAEPYLALVRESRDSKGDRRVPYYLGDGKQYSSDGEPLVWCNKYPGDLSSGKQVRDCDMIYYRTALAVMMDAELKYYKKDYDGALKSLNIIAKRAYGKENYYTDKTPAKVLDAIVNEYFLEFPAEGVIWWALIRLDKIWDYNSDLTAKKASNPNILLWPITTSAITKNSKLVQTEGWY